MSDPPNDPRPRVFVSSVIEGFEAYRETAGQAIDIAGGEPVLVNEQFPSMASSSRNACLDAIESCDYVVLVLGARAGWRAPSGKFVIEEEFDHAQLRKIPVLLFIANSAQEPDAQRLSRQFSDYVNGLFRRKFTSLDDLAREVERALRPLLEKSRLNMDSTPDPIAGLLTRPYSFHDQTALRVAVAPERVEEVFDPVRLASSEFADRVMEIGHSNQVRLFGYGFAKDGPAFERDALVIEQPFGQNAKSGREAVRLAIAESGVVTVDTNVTGRSKRDNSFDMADYFTIRVESIEALLETSLRFVHALYEHIDPHQRHQRFLWNAVLSELGNRTLARNPRQDKHSFTLGTDRQKPSPAFGEARLIQRSELAQPAKEIQRAVIYWTRDR